MKLSKKDIIDDLWIYLEGVEIVCNGNTQDARKEFKQGKNPTLVFEGVLDDSEYNSSIKVYGFTKKLLGQNKYFLGLVPKEVAKAILTGGFLDDVKPSPPHFQKNRKIAFDLVGTIEEAENFKTFFQQVLMDVGFVV